MFGSQTAGGFVTVMNDPLKIVLFELMDVLEQPFRPGVAMQLTWSRLVMAALVYVLEVLFCTSAPFKYQRYVGVPIFNVEAVNPPLFKLPTVAWLIVDPILYNDTSTNMGKVVAVRVLV